LTETQVQKKKRAYIFLSVRTRTAYNFVFPSTRFMWDEGTLLFFPR